MSDPVTRAEIVAAAREWLGTPYHHQASLPGIGCDCLGLVRGVWRDVFGSEPEMPPPYPRIGADAGGKETLALAAVRHLVPIAISQAHPGDVLLFRWRDHAPAGHCAILSGSAPAMMIHAHDGAAVCEVALAPWWRRHLAYAFSFPEVGD